MWLGTYLVRRGLITEAQFVTAVERHLGSKIPFGRLAIEQAMLSISQVFAVLEAQADTQKAFGQAAVDLGYLTRQDVAILLMLQSERSKAIGDALVEMGAITQATLDRERATFHRTWNPDSPSRSRARSAPEVSSPANMDQGIATACAPAH